MYIQLKRRSWLSYQLRRPMLIWKQYRILTRFNKHKLECFLVAIKITRYIKQESV